MNRGIIGTDRKEQQRIASAYLIRTAKLKQYQNRLKKQMIALVIWIILLSGLWWMVVNAV